MLTSYVVAGIFQGEPMTEKQHPAVKKYLADRGRKGGEATLKARGKKFFSAIARKRGRQFPPCPNPRKNDPSKRHRFNPKTGLCYGCGYSRLT